MEEGRASSSASTNRNQEMSALSRIKKDCFSFTVSIQEGFRYFKATLTGQAKKMTARNEKEATEADLQTAKMQVEAVDAAEDAKKRIDKSN
ncbi:uncharacterized protein LOC132273310 [Cornus florida]|uniref:uncharacterized protein LOC132273310 n=1 Tax=Cornus florida TaxID=4283 RepID=UPI00289BB58A|nr:uncharacterized protein LOC132273310 [Cornus florida]